MSTRPKLGVCYVPHFYPYNYFFCSELTSPDWWKIQVFLQTTFFPHWIVLWNVFFSSMYTYIEYKTLQYIFPSGLLNWCTPSDINPGCLFAPYIVIPPFVFALLISLVFLGHNVGLQKRAPKSNWKNNFFSPDASVSPSSFQPGHIAGRYWNPSA